MDRSGKSKSLLQNYIFNFLKTFSSLLFPLITFTYSARILGQEGTGQVNFAKSIISYFTMLAMLGMSQYGTREAAKLRDDRAALSRYAREMLLINGCTTAAAYVLLTIAAVSIPKLSAYKPLLLVCCPAVLLQGMGMEWLYQALEEYRYIAVRSMLFQVAALAAMFVFVRQPEDVIPYALINMCATSGSYLLNFWNARKYVDLRPAGRLQLKKHFRPLLWLFAMSVSIELYTVLDSTMLGFLQNDAAVGRYTAAVKVNKMVNSLITAVGVVLIPRLSYYIGHCEMDKVRKLVKKAYNYVFLLSVPAALGLFVLSDEIIRLFSGNGFASASLTMRLLTPIVLVIPFSVVTNNQAFVPMGKEKLILFSTLAGAVTNFTCNMLLIPRFAENGAAVATVVAETCVALVCFFNAGKYFSMPEIFRDHWQYWLAALPILPIGVLLRNCIANDIVYVAVTVVLSAVCYFSVLLCLRNVYFLEAVDKVKDRLRKIHQGRHSV